MQNYHVVAADGEILSTHKYSNSAKLQKSRKAWMRRGFDVIRIKDFKVVG